MTFAKGRTDCETEREIITQGFKELLETLKQVKYQKSVRIKADLFDVITDCSLSNEERLTKESPLYCALAERDEMDIRIRRTILIGMFSFWELSLKNICEYYKIGISRKNKNQDRNAPQYNKEKESFFSENDYLNAIYASQRPKIISLISSEIKELRNYMTHGTANSNRKAVITNLIDKFPDFCIRESDDGFYIYSYSGLEKILDKIIEGLKYVDSSATGLKA